MGKGTVRERIRVQASDEPCPLADGPHSRLDQSTRLVQSSVFRMRRSLVHACASWFQLAASLPTGPCIVYSVIVIGAGSPVFANPSWPFTVRVTMNTPAAPYA